MSTERVIHSIARLVEVLADKSSINGMADSVFPMNAAERKRRQSMLFRDGSPASIERFPYVGVLKLNEACANILKIYSGVSCDRWEVYYGIFQQPILVDGSTMNGFSCFDGNSSAMFFFNNADEIEVTSIYRFHHVFRINAKDPVYGFEIFLQFVNTTEHY